MDESDYTELSDNNYIWMRSMYGDISELIVDDLPILHGNPVMTTTYKDANLFYDFVTGRAVTRILHLLNQTPIDWFSKRQATVETTTYGLEFIVAWIVVDQIIALCTDLRYFGVPICKKSYLFGNNKSVITSSTIPHSSLTKRHNALACHCVREAVASGFLKFIKLMV